MKKITLLALISLICLLGQSYGQNATIKTFDELKFIQTNLDQIIYLVELDTVELKSVLQENGYSRFSAQNDLITFGKNMFEGKFQTITYSKFGGYIQFIWVNEDDDLKISPFLNAELKSGIQSQNGNDYYKIKRNGIDYTILIQEHEKEDGLGEIMIIEEQNGEKKESEVSFEVIHEEIHISTDQYLNRK